MVAGQVGGSNQLKWQKDILPLLETFTDRTPGTFIEEKKIVWYGITEKPIPNLQLKE